MAFKDFAVKPLKCLPGKAFKDFRAYYPTTLMVGEARSNNPLAADGHKSSVLSLRLLAAAEGER
jgi:hypothetical protein